MEPTTFDGITRTLSTRMTRRSLVAGAAALTTGSALLQVEDVSAKKRRRRKTSKSAQSQSGGQSGGQGSPLAPGSRCQSSSQCSANHICKMPVNGSTCDTYCSGATGAQCGPVTEDGDATVPYCAVGYRCFYNTGSSSGVC